MNDAHLVTPTPTLRNKTSRLRLPQLFTQAKAAPVPAAASRPSSPPPSADSTTATGPGDLGLAPDFSYVETTSGTAAKALASWYEQQGGGSHYVQERKQGDKTIWRIRPRSQPPNLQDGGTRTSLSDPQSPTSPTNPTFTFHAASPSQPLKKESRLRSYRSIPQLRQKLGFGSSSSHLDELPLPSSLSARDGRRRAGSTPPMKTRGSPVVESEGSHSDVLGRLLGWSDVSASNLAASQRPPSSEPIPTVVLQDGGIEVSTDGRAEEAAQDSSPSRSTSPLTPIASDLLPSLTPPPSSRHTPFGSGVRGSNSLAPASGLSEFGIQSLNDGDGPSSRSMREMASSDSIRTAKADDERPKLKRKRFEDPTLFDVFQSRAVIAGPPSAARRHDRLPSNSSVASSNSDTSRTAPHRITVSTSATEDPRFAIWGLKDGPTRPAAAGGDRYGSIAQEMEVGSPVSTTMSDRGSPATMGSTRWSLRRSVASNGDNSSPASSVRGSVGSNGGYPNRQQRVLMAATVERWVAELTSKIEADLLSGFFLTYRSFVRPLDLLRLLITRFQWAMAVTATAEDGAARRIVRVRTFVVIRHWLLNHFTDDFLPDRQLRTTLTEWLNASSREPRILESAKDERLIKGLKKLVRRLKEMHVALGPGDTAEAARELSGGYAHVGVSSSTTAHGSRTRGSDDDVDLEVVAPSLSFDPSSPPPPIRSPAAAQVFHVKVDPIQFSTSRSSHIFNSDPNPTLPGPDNVIARSFNSALGTIGRFKRILSNRSPTPAPSFGACVNAEAFDEDLFRTSDTGDLLWVKGGLDRFLQFYNIQHDAGAETTPLDLEELGIIGAQSLETLVQSDDQVDPVDVSGDGLGISGVEHAEETMMKKAAPTYLSHAQSGRSLRTDLTRLGVTPSFTPETSAYDLLDQPLDNLFLQRPGSTRIELDDVDLSDEDDDVVEVKRTLKRLPGASDLRTAAFARHLAGPPRGNRYSNSSVSSYGSRIDRTSMVSEGSHENLPEGIQVVPNFILEGIDTSDDEEPGDVEAALRRLEGIVDDSKEKEKARRVERQMAKSNQLEQLKQLGASLSRPMDVLPPPRPPSVVCIDPAPVVLPLEEEADAETRSPTEEREELDTVPSSRLQLPPQPSSLSRRGGLRTMPSISKLFAAASKPPPRPPVVAPPVHRSFLLVARTEVLAQQFCLIERDMLRCMGWQELVGGDWSDPARRLDVLDWERYLKERRKLELAARATGVRAPSDVQAVIARFNLTANWVCSEIVLTASIDDRVTLIAKLIRLAFKCYRQSNFQTLTQILYGLQLPDVERLKKTWARVPSWEMRQFRSMKEFVSLGRNFKLLREATNARVAEYGPPGQHIAVLNTSRGVGSAQASTGCIPFFGLFLHDLSINTELPTFLDPTSPNSAAHVDANGSLESVADPLAFAELPPLPDNLPLAPLVNVHKFRVVANVVQQVLSLQECAEGYSYEPEPSLYFKCLKIRCLPPNLLRECSLRIEP